LDQIFRAQKRLVGRTFASLFCDPPSALKPLFLVTLLLAVTALAEDPRVTALIVQGDAEERLHRSKEALAAFQQAEAIEARNVGVLLRISKQYSDLVSQATAPAPAKALAFTALDYGKRAVEIDGKNAKAHLNLAVCYGKLTDYVGSKTKLEYSRIIRDEVHKSLALDATDDFAWHVLGRWHQGVASVGPVMKALAKVVYGGLPEASGEEAARCLKKATELAPERIIHHAELAKIYALNGKYDLAAQAWQNVLGLKAADHEDEKYQEAAKVALEAHRPERSSGWRMLTSGRNGR
jgi:tetratricopeptide (TPR) repeat protein